MFLANPGKNKMDYWNWYLWKTAPSFLFFFKTSSQKLWDACINMHIWTTFQRTMTSSVYKSFSTLLSSQRFSWCKKTNTSCYITYSCDAAWCIHFFNLPTWEIKKLITPCYRNKARNKYVLQDSYICDIRHNSRLSRNVEGS